MLDTLHLTLKDWKVRAGAKLQVNTGNMDFQTGEVKQSLLFKDNTGRETFGSRAHNNTEKLNFTIRPYANEVMAFVNFSAPKRLNENNYYPIKEDQLPEVFESVENELYESGIETHIDKAKLSRVDTFKNILTDQETECYSRLFGLLQANRARNKSTYGVNGWLMRDKASTQYCIYDKLEEMRHAGLSTLGLEKTLRFEHRCLTSSKVQNFFKFANETSVEELKKYGWNALQERNVRAWTDNFFKYEIADFEIIVESTLRNEMQYFHTKYGRMFFSKYLKAYGAFFLASSSGGVEVIKRALQNMNIEEKRKKIYRAERELREALILVESLKLDSTSPKTIGELYAELKYKMEKV